MSHIILPTSGVLSREQAPATSPWVTYDGTLDGSTYDFATGSFQGKLSVVGSNYVGWFYNAGSQFQVRSLNFTSKTINSVSTAVTVVNSGGLATDKQYSTFGGNTMAFLYYEGNYPVLNTATFDGSGVATVNGGPYLQQNVSALQTTKIDDTHILNNAYYTVSGKGNVNVLQLATLSGNVATLGNVASPSTGFQGGGGLRSCAALSTTIGLGGWWDGAVYHLFPVTYDLGAGTITGGTGLTTSVTGGAFSMAKVDSTNAVLVSDTGDAYILTTDGSTVTVGSTANFSASCIGIGSPVVDLNCVIIPYQTSDYKYWVVVGVITGTTISFGTPVDTGIVGNASLIWINAAPIDSNRIMLTTKALIGGLSHTGFKIIAAA